MCEHTRLVVCEGHHVCVDCGAENADNIYVTSYNRTFSYRQAPVYCRQKRFLLFVRSLKRNVLFLNEDKILTIFGTLEFFFNLGHKFNRKYFFNRHVTLIFILSLLDIQLDTKTLKDPLRVEQQLSEMKQIFELKIFPK